VPFHQGGQLSDQLAMATERQIRLDALLQRLEMEFLGLADRGLRKRLIGEVSQRRAAPQSQPRAQDPRGLFRIAHGHRLSALLDQSTEPVKVELAGLHPQQITAPAGDKHPLSKTLTAHAGRHRALCEDAK
jgi:hypothetical protein